MAATTEDIASLVVSVSADITKLRTEMSKVAGVTAKAMKEAEKATVASNDNMSRSFAKTGDAAQRSMRGARAEAANMSAQFQDIAVQLQSGTSPLTIAFQQGTQLAGVLQNVQAQGGGLFKSLGAALASFVNPIQIVTIGLIALGGYAIQYFASIGEGSKQSEEEMKKHLDQLLQTADAYRNALSPALNAYLDGLREKANLEEQTAGTAALVQKEAQNIANTLLGLSSSFLNAMDSMALPPDQLDALGEAQKLLDQISIDLEQGRVNASDMGESLDLIISILKTMEETKAVNSLILDLERARAALLKNADDLKTATKAKEEFAKAGQADMTAFNKAMKELGALAAPVLSEMERAMKAYDDAVKAAKGNTELLAQAQRQLGVAMSNINAEALQKVVGGIASNASDMVKIIGQIESAGKNLGQHSGASSASGIFGFVDKTWISTLRSLGGEFKNLSDAQLLALKGNAEIQTKAAEQLMNINNRLLTNAGQAINDVNTYMSHFLGSGGALDVLRNVGTGNVNFLSPSTLQNHRELAGKTAEEIIAIVQGKIDKAKIELKLTPKVETDDLQTAITRVQEKVAADLAEARSVGEITEAIDVEAYTREKVRVQMELMATARADGTEATAEEKAQIDAVAESAGLAAGQIKNYAETQKQLGKDTKDAVKEQQKQQQQIEQTASQMASMATSFVTGFISDIKQGKSATEALTNSLSKLADQLLEMALNSLFKNLFTNLLGGLGGGAPTFGTGDLFAQKGGLVGSAGIPRKYGVSPLAFLGAPRMASGGMVGVGPGEFPAILHRGEVVIPASLVRQAAGMGGSSSGQAQTTRITIGNVSITARTESTGDVKADTERGKALGRNMLAMVQAELTRQTRPGGLLTATGSGGRVGR